MLITLAGIYGCYAQKKAVYSMFLEEAVPANGTMVVFNAPILRWPFQKGKQVKYEVELSQDTLFSAPATISAEALTGAVFNPHQPLKQGKWYWHYRVAGKSWSTVMNFIVTEKALAMVSPKPTVFLEKVPQTHPRILINNPAGDITKLAKQADAVMIIGEAEKAMSEKIPVEKDAISVVVVTDEKQNEKLQTVFILKSLKKSNFEMIKDIDKITTINDVLNAHLKFEKKY